MGQIHRSRVYLHLTVMGNARMQLSVSRAPWLVSSHCHQSSSSLGCSVTGTMLGLLLFPSNCHAVSNIIFFISLIVFQPIPDLEMKRINPLVVIHYLRSFSFSKCLALE